MTAPIQDLNLGKVTHADRFCQLHGERVRYYCETEQKQVCPDCVGLKTCAVEHDRVSMKDAAKKQAAKMDELIQECKVVNLKVQNAVKDTTKIRLDLIKAEKDAKAALAKVKKDYIARVDALIKEQERQLSNIVRTRNKELQTTIDVLRKKSTEMTKACEKASELTRPGKEFEITYRYHSVTKFLQEQSASQSKLSAANKSLSNLKFEPHAPTISSIGKLQS